MLKCIGRYYAPDIHHYLSKGMLYAYVDNNCIELTCNQLNVDIMANTVVFLG